LADNEIEISVRIEFFRDMSNPHLLDATEKEYAGAMSRHGFKVVSVPRVGEYVLALNAEMPFPFSPVSAVEHRLGWTERDSADELVDDSPSVMVVIRVPWPGDDEIDDVVQKFRERDWVWTP
jgi:hypothetical protein